MKLQEFLEETSKLERSRNILTMEQYFDSMVDLVQMSDFEGVTEVFTLPFKAKKVAKISNSWLYSTDGLKKSYINAMKKRKETRRVSKKIEELTIKGDIIPCWMSRGIPSLLFFKIFAPIAIKSMRGFFYPTSERIYLLMDTNINIFSYAPNKVLAILTLHEGQHMFAWKHSSSFLSTFKSTLTTFYSNLLKPLFGIPEGRDIDRASYNFFRFIHKNFELAKTHSSMSSKFSKYTKFLIDSLGPYTTFPNHKFEDQAHIIADMAQLFLRDSNLFFNKLSTFRSYLMEVYNAYNKTFRVKDIHTLPIQEYVYPSEVIAVASEFGFSKIYSSFKRL